MELVDKTAKEEFIVTSFKIPKSLRKKIKEIAVREDRDIQDIVTEKLEEYVKVHGDGNPIFTLDKFQDSDFKICPAFFTKHEKWVKYFKSLSHNEKVDFEKQFGVVKHAYNSS